MAAVEVEDRQQVCGFAAIVSLGTEPVSAGVVSRMTEVIRHRGPDDEGYFVSGRVGFGFRRLSILDMSPLGHQPMQSDDGQVTLVFNGEIYNYVELRGDLETLGHRFKSTGDTEVLMRAYLQWGSDCVRRFNGMWAFLVYDARSGKLFGSRDRFGIKPLYRHMNGGHVLLASEIKAIRASGLYGKETNWTTVARFMFDGRLDDTHETFYAGIEQVPPGTSFELDPQGRLRQWRYWSLEELPALEVADPAREFAHLFEDAVRLHMRSDVPVGVHLSGGLDSTSIVCAVARLRRAANSNTPLLAFSYMDPDYEESRYIADTVEQAQATLVRLTTDPLRLWSIVKEVLSFQDEPVYSMMPLVVYELMRLTAANGIKVVLNGQGADETIAGYPSLFREYWCTLIAAGQPAYAWSEVGRHAQANGGQRSKLFLDSLRHLAQSRLSAVAPYRRLARWRRRRRHRQHRWFTPQLAELLPLAGYDEQPALSLNEVLARSVYRTPLPQILRIEDRNSMAHSIESRLPFLDYRLVSLVFGLPADWHMRGPWNKFVLREAMRGRIPESVRSRIDKMGFPVPARQWIAGALHEPVLDLLHSRKLRERGIYDVDNMIDDMKRHRAQEIDISDGIFDVAQLEIWSDI